MAQKRLLSEILESVGEAPTSEDKAIVLQNENSLPLRQLLQAALEPKIEFDVEILPYRENKEVDGYASNSLYVEYKRLYVFMKNNTSVTAKRKAQILGGILESIDPKDAKFLELVIKKDLSKYGVTAEVVNEAFPGLIKG